jgi:hypothetical protein
VAEIHHEADPLVAEAQLATGLEQAILVLYGGGEYANAEHRGPFLPRQFRDI